MPVKPISKDAASVPTSKLEDEGSKSTKDELAGTDNEEALLTTTVVVDKVPKPMKGEMASKEDDDTRSTTTSTSTPRGRRSSVGSASGFSFRLEERAEKRKEIALCLQHFHFRLVRAVFSFLLTCVKEEKCNTEKAGQPNKSIKKYI